MKIVRPSDNEIIELIEYGIAENQVSMSKITNSNINNILYDYKTYCHDEEKKTKKELDTFTRAACLMIATYEERLTSDNIINASIAISTATKMCENAYVEDAANNTLVVLKEIDIQKVYENDPDLYNYWTKSLYEGLVFGIYSVEQYSQCLKTFHEVTTRLCEETPNKQKTK